MNNVKTGDTIVVWFSCGAASAVAAKRTIEKYGDIAKIRVVNNPVKEEHEDNARFLQDVEKWLGVKIETATCEKYPSCSAIDVWQRERFMSGPAGAPCTKFLKKAARLQWEKRNHHDWMVLGFTAEEKRRSDKFILGERATLIPVLINDDISKQDCLNIIGAAGIRIPELYLMGYPNNNCIGCVKATSPTYWNHVRVQHPDVFRARAEQSREIGAKLARHKGTRLFLDELPEDAKGAPLKSMDFDCGIFCEEKF